MMYCVACRKVSPSGSIYCGYCLAGFNARVCSNCKHRNPPAARNSGPLGCCRCASVDLSPSVTGLPLGCLTGLATCLVTLLLVRVTVANIGAVASWLLHGAGWGIGFVFGTDARGAFGAVRAVANLVLVAWLCGQLLVLLPGRGDPVGGWLRGLPLLLIRLVGRFLTFLACLAAAGFRRLFWGVGTER